MCYFAFQFDLSVSSLHFQQFQTVLFPNFNVIHLANHLCPGKRQTVAARRIHSFFMLLNSAFMLFILFVIAHTNKNNFAVIVFQDFRILSVVDLLNSPFCCLVPFQFYNHCRQYSPSFREKHNICHSPAR